MATDNTTNSTSEVNDTTDIITYENINYEALPKEKYPEYFANFSSGFPSEILMVVEFRDSFN